MAVAREDRPTNQGQKVMWFSEASAICLRSRLVSNFGNVT